MSESRNGCDIYHIYYMESTHLRQQDSPYGWIPQRRRKMQRQRSIVRTRNGRHGSPQRADDLTERIGGLQRIGQARDKLLADLGHDGIDFFYVIREKTVE